MNANAFIHSFIHNIIIIKQLYFFFSFSPGLYLWEVWDLFLESGRLLMMISYGNQGSSGGSAKCLESPDMPSGHVRSHSGDAVLKKIKIYLSVRPHLPYFKVRIFRGGASPPRTWHLPIHDYLCAL